MRALLDDWPIWARQDQLPPLGSWRKWLVLGGRGSGKTRTGAEHIRAMSKKCASIALVGETFNDVREVMIEGVSGLRAISLPDERPVFEVTRKRLLFPNGAVAYAFSGEDPESLRGPQFSYAWIDEYAKYKQGQAVMDMLSFGLRLGENPRMVITTTPRATPFLRALMKEQSVVISHSKTHDNIHNLAANFIANIEDHYKGTRLGRQELEGELIEENDQALWSRAMIEDCRIKEIPALKRIVIAIDPPVSSGKNADQCGLVVAGIDEHNQAIVLEDASAQGLKPLEWASRAVNLYHKYKADRIIAESNQGGEMVETILREIDPDVAIEKVFATRGKYLRAEPVAALYQQGRVKHAKAFSELEDEMCDYSPDGLSNGASPDRLDALVWAITALVLKGRAKPRVMAWGAL